MPEDFVVSPFDAIRHYDKNGNEYWSARELHKILGYTEWRNFHDVVITRAKRSCEERGGQPLDHFVQSYNMIPTGKGAHRKVSDIFLTRYAAYLTTMNGEPNMPMVAAGQEYFATQTRRQELADEAEGLPESEEERRIRLRGRMRYLDTQLSSEAKKAGAEKPRDYAVFFDSGYQGLYGGETENDIHTRKDLKPKEKILDHMVGDELSYNEFRATLAKQRLEKEQPKRKEQANDTHYEVGSAVRKTIEDQGGILPEDLPTPTESVQQLEREREQEIQQFLRRREQPMLPMFTEIEKKSEE